MQSPPAGEKLGEVHFPISCNSDAQKRFDRAVAILHSMWYEEAVKAFTGVAEADPACAMAWWGVAMSHWYPLWYPPPPAALKAGAAAVAKAEAVGAKTERERGYIAAIATFYRNSDTLDHRTRALAYEHAMASLHQHYPEDREAAIFYALALDATALPTDKTYANQKKAAAILEPIFAEQPNHPGVAHYLIHSDDAPPLAEAGLPAARRYAKIAPSVPHALHMPSHIFTRLGYWQESIDTNLRSAAAGQAYAKAEFGEGVAWDQSLHAMDYLAYAYLQLGEDQKARAVVDEIMAFKKVTPDTPPRRLRDGRHPGPLRGRAAKLGGGGEARIAACSRCLGQVSLDHGDDHVRARPGGCAHRRPRRRQGRDRQARGHPRRATRGQEQILVRPGRGAAPGRGRDAGAGRRPARRGGA